MKTQGTRDTHRRTAVKSLLWRLIGIFWTWGGAFVIILLLPDKYRTNALVIATLVTLWHHSTRMVMYYGYERAWESIAWGRDGDNLPLSRRTKFYWGLSITLCVVVIFWLMLAVSPKIKKFQKDSMKNKPTEEMGKK